MGQVLLRFLGFLLAFTLIASAKAQEPISKEATISYLNQRLVGSDVLSLKGKFLEIESSREGTRIKNDKINIYDLDPKSVRYVAEENLVMATCFDDADGCIERLSLKVSRKSYRKRVTFVADNKLTGEIIANALRHLISVHADKDYIGPTSFE
jgi:hypothetical protein